MQRGADSSVLMDVEDPCLDAAIGRVRASRGLDQAVRMSILTLPRRVLRLAGLIANHPNFLSIDQLCAIAEYVGPHGNAQQLNETLEQYAARHEYYTDVCKRLSDIFSDAMLFRATLNQTDPFYISMQDVIEHAQDFIYPGVLPHFMEPLSSPYRITLADLKGLGPRRISYEAVRVLGDEQLRNQLIAMDFPMSTILQLSSETVFLLTKPEFEGVRQAVSLVEFSNLSASHQASIFELLTNDKIRARLGLPLDHPGRLTFDQIKDLSQHALAALKDDDIMKFVDMPKYQKVGLTMQTVLQLTPRELEVLKVSYVRRLLTYPRYEALRLTLEVAFSCSDSVLKVFRGVKQYEQNNQYEAIVKLVVLAENLPGHLPMQQLISLTESQFILLENRSILRLLALPKEHPQSLTIKDLFKFDEQFCCAVSREFIIERLCLPWSARNRLSIQDIFALTDHSRRAFSNEYIRNLLSRLYEDPQRLTVRQVLGINPFALDALLTPEIQEMLKLKERGHPRRLTLSQVLRIRTQTTVDALKNPTIQAMLDASLSPTYPMRLTIDQLLMITPDGLRALIDQGPNSITRHVELSHLTVSQVIGMSRTARTFFEIANLNRFRGSVERLLTFSPMYAAIGFRDTGLTRYVDQLSGYTSLRRIAEREICTLSHEAYRAFDNPAIRFRLALPKNDLGYLSIQQILAITPVALNALSNLEIAGRLSSPLAVEQRLTMRQILTMTQAAFTALTSPDIAVQIGEGLSLTQILQLSEFGLQALSSAEIMSRVGVSMQMRDILTLTKPAYDALLNPVIMNRLGRDLTMQQILSLTNAAYSALLSPYLNQLLQLEQLLKITDTALQALQSPTLRFRLYLRETDPGYLTLENILHLNKYALLALQDQEVACRLYIPGFEPGYLTQQLLAIKHEHTYIALSSPTITHRLNLISSQRLTFKQILDMTPHVVKLLLCRAATDWLSPNVANSITMSQLLQASPGACELLADPVVIKALAEYDENLIRTIVAASITKDTACLIRDHLRTILQLLELREPSAELINEHAVRVVREGRRIWQVSDFLSLPDAPAELFSVPKVIRRLFLDSKDPLFIAKEDFLAIKPHHAAVFKWGSEVPETHRRGLTCAPVDESKISLPQGVMPGSEAAIEHIRRKKDEKEADAKRRLEKEELKIGGFLSILSELSPVAVFSFMGRVPNNGLLSALLCLAQWEDDGVVQFNGSVVEIYKSANPFVELQQRYRRPTHKLVDFFEQLIHFLWWVEKINKASGKNIPIEIWLNQVFPFLAEWTPREIMSQWELKHITSHVSVDEIADTRRTDRLSCGSGVGQNRHRMWSGGASSSGRVTEVMEVDRP